MTRRFTITDLLFWMAFVALVLAFTVPLWRMIARAGDLACMVEAVAASADGSTFGALLGDGKVLVWDSSGTLKSALKRDIGLNDNLALSFNGRYAAVFGAWMSHVGEPHGGVEIWDISTGKVVKSLATDARSLTFSPTEDIYCLIDNNSTEIQRVAADVPTFVVRTYGDLARFSHDGRKIAVAVYEGGIHLYDVETQRLFQKFSSEKFKLLEGYDDLAWSNDDSELAALRTVSITLGMSPVTAANEETALQVWNLANGELRTAPAAGDASGTLAFLPNGPALVVTARGSRAKFLDARNLTPLSNGIDTEIDMVAAGLRGDSFITAGTDNVDLWDVATFKPRRRLFEGSPEPSFIPALIGLMAWFVWFNFRRIRKLARPCQTCGQWFQPNGPKDANVDCPACRQKAEAKRFTLKEMAKRQRAGRHHYIARQSTGRARVGHSRARRAGLSARRRRPD